MAKALTSSDDPRFKALKREWDNKLKEIEQRKLKKALRKEAKQIRKNGGKWYCRFCKKRKPTSEFRRYKHLLKNVCKHCEQILKNGRIRSAQRRNRKCG